MIKHVLAASLLSVALMPLQSNAASLKPMAPNVEYFRDYEEAYLAECAKRQTAVVCQRSMEQLQARLGFFEFATQVSTGALQVVAKSN